MRECFGPPARRTRDWRTVWRIKDRLPRGSHYKAALAMDEELAERLLAREDELERDPDREPEITPEGYSIDTYLLLSVIDAMQGVQAAVIAAAGVDPPAVHPMPRPATALDVVRERRRLHRVQRLIDEFTSPAFAGNLEDPS